MKYVPKELEHTADASRGQASPRTTLKVVGVVVGVAVAVYASLGWIADLVAARISDQKEAEWFQVDLGSPPKNNEDVQRARAILERLRTGPGLRDLPYRLFYLDEPLPNAFALPGGGIGITAGLRDAAKSDMGLAMVLAHELGHHAHRDALRAMGRALLQHTALSLMFGRSGVSVFETAALLADRQYSQAAEFRADEFGLRLVHKVYGTTTGTLDFFESMSAMESEAGRALAWASTHPLTTKRIERLRRLSEKLGGRDLGMAQPGTQK